MTELPTRDRFIEAARSIVPQLAGRAAETENLRRLPEANVEAIVDAGLHRIYQPARYGGAEMDYTLQLDIGLALGAGCAATAWVALFYATHPFVVGMMEPEAQDDVWRQTPDALIANAFFLPVSTCTPVDGGFLLDGPWIVSSGVDHCHWNNLNVLVPTGDGPPEHRFMLVPKADFTVMDDWQANGLAGTGSHSIRLDKVFVPEHRTLRTLDCRGGPTPGSAASNSYLYRLPLMATFPAGACVSAPGIARGALDAMCAGMNARRNVGGAPVADLPTVQIRLSEAAAEIDSAEALLRRDLEEIDRMGAAGELPTIAQRARYRRDWGYAVELSVRAIDRIYPLGGAKSLAATSPLQRAWRDLHAQASHAALNWDIQAQHYGRALLDVPLADPRI